MAEHFRVGRNAVREAFRGLEMAGVVRLQKGRNGGAYIRPGNPSRITLALRDLLEFGSVSLPELTAARTQIMEIVTRGAIERMTESDFENLERIIDETDEYTKLGLMEKRSERISAFYETLAQIAGNRVLVMIIMALSESLRRFIIASYPAPPQDTLVASRRRFLKYLRAGDAEKASKEMRSAFIDLQRRLESSAEARAATSTITKTRQRGKAIAQKSLPR